MTSLETSDMPDHSRSKDRSARETLLMGVFWKVLIIGVILLIGTLAYEAGFRDADPSHLIWYALRILGLIGIIILFMMVTLQRFLRKKRRDVPYVLKLTLTLILASWGSPATSQENVLIQGAIRHRMTERETRGNL